MSESTLSIKKINDIQMDVLERTYTADLCVHVKGVWVPPSGPEGADVQAEPLAALNGQLISWVNGKSRSRFVSRWKINSLLECTGQEGHDGGGSRWRWEGLVRIRGKVRRKWQKRQYVYSRLFKSLSKCFLGDFDVFCEEAPNTTEHS